jgi:DNA-binding MarR family transcriptional regulator
LPRTLGWLLSQASHVLKTELTAALESVGISPRALHVLKTAMQDEYTQTELARIVGLDKTTMVVTLD